MPYNKDVVQGLQEILRQWEESQSVVTNDPTPSLIKLCELFERETINFLKQDPDPFDDRHPVISKPDCAYGQILRALFKKETFVNKLVGQYLKENYFSSLGLRNTATITTNLNTSACRLLLDILHGIDTPQVFQDSETTVLKLYQWAEKGPEPLRTYATGLLAAANETPDFATSFRDQNANLVPLMLKRLWELKNEESSSLDDYSTNKRLERPFAQLGKYDTQEFNKESEEKGTKTKYIGSSPQSGGCSSSVTNYNIIFGSPKDDAASDINFAASNISSDCSNSSWAEMSSNIVGTYQMFPINRETKQMFILKYLKPVGEYQESLGYVYEHHALDLVFHYLNVKVINHARLSFEALRFLGSLLFHKKFCLQFVIVGGVQKLIQVPRPSLPADGVALCLWYLAFCEEAIERICLLSDHYVFEVTRYALWLLECAHQSSRTHAVMFFGMVFKFRAILEKFDEQDGLRKLVNSLSTLSIFQENWDQDVSEEPNEAMMWQTVRQGCLSMKNYFEAHLALKVQQLRLGSSSSSSTSCSALTVFQHSIPAYKAMNTTQEAVERNVEYLLEHLPYRCRWKPVEQFLSLKGLQLCLKLVATVLNDSFSFSLNRTETAVYALDSVYVCSIMPVVQSALCDRLTIPAGEDLLNMQPQEVPGYAVLVACIPENCQTISSTPEVQKASLNALVNCLCAPVHRPGSISDKSRNPSGTPGSSSKKRMLQSSEEVIRKSWQCIRTSNGIMYLISLLHKKVPITDADCIRGLACRALVGLARCDNARQIMSKLPIFSSGQLQLLMKEPILQDKRIEHVKFQKHALELIKAISGRFKSQDGASVFDVSLQSIQKADIVAQTHINYNKKQLLQLIQHHLLREGYESVAQLLQKEASLPKIAQNVMAPPPRGMCTPPPPSLKSRVLTVGSSGSGRSSSAISKGPLQTTPGLGNHINSPITIKINRSSKKINFNTSYSNYNGNSNLINDSNNFTSPGIYSSSLSRPEVPLTNVVVPANACNPLVTEPAMSLDRIVVEYLTNQHALCKNPVVTCPTFDLFQPHRCPEPKQVRTAPNNFVLRYSKREYSLPYYRNDMKAQNRKFLYSRFRSSHVVRPVDEDEVFLTCEFTPDDQHLLIGTVRGEVRMYNRNSDSIIAMETVHQSMVTSLVAHSNGELLLTSSSGIPEAALWALGPVFDSKCVITNCNHAEFTTSQDMMLGTMDQTAKLYDLNTTQVVSEFTPKLSNHYKMNKAALDPTDKLLLTDGVLFDVKSGKQIHKFDKINPLLNGMFHRNGLEVISSSEIWDLRTFHLLRTVPTLAICDISFNHMGDVIFGITVNNLDDTQDNAFETSFKTVDAYDYSCIATVDVRRIVSCLCINHTDTEVVVVEADEGSDSVTENAVARIYSIGMTKQEEDEAMEDEDEEDLGSDDDSDDSEDDNDDNDEDDDDEDDDNVVLADVEPADENELQDLQGNDDPTTASEEEEGNEDLIQWNYSPLAEEEEEEEQDWEDDSVLFELNSWPARRGRRRGRGRGRGRGGRRVRNLWSSSRPSEDNADEDDDEYEDIDVEEVDGDDDDDDDNGEEEEEAEA